MLELLSCNLSEAGVVLTNSTCQMQKRAAVLQRVVQRLLAPKPVM